MPVRVAIVSDTVDDVNGVAIGLKRLVTAARREGHSIVLVGPAGEESEGVLRVPAAMSSSLPFYPQMTWSAPDLGTLVEVLSFHADIVQVATPGPMGIAALIAARMLKLPVVAQYHTEVAEYAARMTGLPMLRGIIEPLVGWFYKQADLCLAPSAAVTARLVALGVSPAKIARVPRGVDLSLFNPARRDPRFTRRLGVGDGPLVLYVGRLSREKNLDALAEAWPVVREAHPSAQLLVVGAGPYEMASADGITFAGMLFDTELATAFASADIFAFPSETETFGNVVVEAAATGLPVIVPSAGAAHEHVVDGVTGIVTADGTAAAFAAAITTLIADETSRASMGIAARRHALGYEMSAAVSRTWKIYEQFESAGAARQLAV